MIFVHMHGDTFFKTQDLNKDGVISYEEFAHDEL